MNVTGFYSQTITYVPNSNQMDTYSSQSVSYDGAGNLLANGAGTTFTYTPSNRLDTITSGTTITNLYNGVGELVRAKTVPFCQCGGCAKWNEYFEFTPDGRALSLIQQGINANGSTGSRIEWDWIWLDGIPVAQIEETYASDGTHMGTEITYLHTDQLGTPRLGTDQNKTVTWEYKSDAFGMAQLSGTATVRLRMPGQIDYGLAGIYYNYYRDYDSSTGRYLESDPVGLDGGLNTYGYVEQNPVRLSDPFGLDPGDIFPTADAAAKDALCYINPRTDDTGLEFASRIYFDFLKGGYSYGDPVVGNRRQSYPVLSKVPLLSHVVASFHTHPLAPPGYSGDEEFSPADLRGPSIEYLATPSYRLLKFDPDFGQPREILNTSRDECECSQ